MYVEIECGGYLKAISGHAWAKPWSGLGSGEGIWMSIRRVNEMNETGQIDITLGLFDNRYEMISWYTLSIAVNSSFYYRDRQNEKVLAFENSPWSQRGRMDLI